MDHQENFSDNRFEYLLKQAITEKLTSEEDGELWNNYFGITEHEKAIKY